LQILAYVLPTQFGNLLLIGSVGASHPKEKLAQMLGFSCLSLQSLFQFRFDFPPV